VGDEIYQVPRERFKIQDSLQYDAMVVIKHNGVINVNLR
jgi:hypothetical protein